MGLEFELGVHTLKAGALTGATSNSFPCEYFIEGGLWNYLPRPSLNLDPPILASQVAGITGMYHCIHLSFPFFFFFSVLGLEFRATL
jgi:hypothetical protein